MSHTNGPVLANKAIKFKEGLTGSTIQPLCYPAVGLRAKEHCAEASSNSISCLTKLCMGLLLTPMVPY